MADEKLSFTEHLEELRKRVIRCVIAIVIGFSISYAFSKTIYDFLARPLINALPPGSSLIFTTPTEAFLTYLKTAFFAGILLASPVILHQVWRFITPGLYEKERNSVTPFMIISAFLFLAGAAFGYYFVLPSAFRYLMGFASSSIHALPSMKEYFSFASMFLFAFGIIFELPIFILFLAKLGIVTYPMLCKFHKYAIILCFFLAAVLTPGPDPFSQIMMAVPLLILFEVSLLLAKVFGKKAE
jgi:sec-independent protein translocase protein TatC